MGTCGTPEYCEIPVLNIGRCLSYGQSTFQLIFTLLKSIYFWIRLVVIFSGFISLVIEYNTCCRFVMFSHNHLMMKFSRTIYLESFYQFWSAASCLHLHFDVVSVIFVLFSIQTKFDFTKSGILYVLCIIFFRSDSLPFLPTGTLGYHKHENS
ncbi:uncharacterized protein LOC120329834 isoform X2 [Styela clava]